MASQSDDLVYEFGPYRLLPRRYLLSRQGVRVQLGFKVFEILVLLVRKHGEVISKEEIIRHVWPDAFVHESNLKVNIATLRKVLGEHEPGGPYIVNVPRQGYRFVGPVRVVIDESGSVARQTAFSPPQTLPAVPSMIGRAEVLGDLAGYLDAAYCVSIVGPGGVGKTTVAVALAHAVAAQFGDGVCFVDLSALDDPQYVPAAAAAALGVRTSVRDLNGEIVTALRTRRVLVVLDNCEHLSMAVAGLIEPIVASAPACRIVTTSREPLRVTGEAVYRLATLAVPVEGGIIPPDRASRYPAIGLFVVKAHACSGFVLTAGNVGEVASICRRLDGLPLAIELAAAKTVAYSTTQLLEMLEHRFRVLNFGRREAPVRQQTLLATLDWSYRLLSDEEAALLRQLSVFAGFFGLQDAVAVAGGLVPLGARGVIDILSQLVAKSLVTADYYDGDLRHRLLESTRAYAAERLSLAGEEHRAAESHARHMLEVFKRAEEEWSWRVMKDWLAIYACRIDDLRKAIEWAFGPSGSLSLGIELTAAAIPLWDELSSMVEARHRVDRALTAVEKLGDCPPEVRMKLATAHAWSMNFAQHLVPGTEAAWADSMRFSSEANSTEYQLRSIWGFSVYLMYTGRHAEAKAELERFAAIASQHSDGSALPDGERLLALVDAYLGRSVGALARLETLAAQHAKLDERSRTARFQLDRYVAIRCSLSFVLWLTGHPQRAARVALEAVSAAQRIGHIVSQSNALALAALPVSVWLGDYENATLYQETLDDNNRRENLEIWRPVSCFFGGAILAARGSAEGVEQMRMAISDLIDGRFLVRTPMYHSMLAEAHLANDQPGAARTTLERARSSAEAQGEQWCLAEIFRIEGALLLREGREREAERSFLGALATARSAGALAFELRAVLAVHELWSSWGRDEPARRLLENIVSRFGDQTGSADLEQARLRLGLGASGFSTD